MVSYTDKFIGKHVPAIGNLPGHFANGEVYGDLIDATDFLPTICEAIGISVPADLKIDSRSFLPQLRGGKGNPRDWPYVWYNQGGGPKAKAEFAHDANFKLYTDGRFYAVEKDDNEKSPLPDAGLDDTTKAARMKLQNVLNQFKGPRPEFFVKQAQPVGGESGEDSEGNKTTKIKGKRKKSAQ